MPPSARRLLAAISDACERWSDADFPERVRATASLEERTGYSMPVIEYALDRLFGSVTQAALEVTIASELGSLETLDGFAHTPGRPRAWAQPLGRVCVISSRTTVGVAILPAIFALCAKNSVLVKDREDRLVSAFFKTLAEELDYFESAARAEIWSGERGGQNLAAFDGVAAFGRDDTLIAIRAGLHANARFVGYGGRASAGYIAREDCTALSLKNLLPGAARDAVLYESEGCLSLHVLFVEDGGETAPHDVAGELGKALGFASVEFPPGRRDAAVSAAVGNARNLAAFRAAAGNGAVFWDEACTYALLFDPPRNEAPAFLPRLLALLPVCGPGDAAAYLQTHALPLEGFALSSPRADIVAMATDTGAARVVRFGDLQHPPIAGRHGGRPRIAEFVRWVQAEV
ncbi:MAG: hypothetical protein GIW95_04310 [Candidatus Eremiobacteraeota bacterium]|nr:hypothetical protein [Candidatus Eremiobacteraeota bacterium]